MVRVLVLIGGMVPLLALGLPQPLTAPTASLPGCSVADFSLDTEEMAFLAVINDYRADNGLSPLSLSENLNRAAMWMATDMATNNRFGHTDSTDRGPFERTVDCGYPVPAGENLAAGSGRSLAAAAFELFHHSPSHNSNMLKPEYRQIGIARVYEPGSQHTWYWATNFGTVDDTIPPPVRAESRVVLAWKAASDEEDELPRPGWEAIDPGALATGERVAGSEAASNDVFAEVDAIVEAWSGVPEWLPPFTGLPVPEGSDGFYRVSFP